MADAKVFKLKVLRGFSTVIAIDGYAVDATVKRLSPTEYASFMAGYARVQDPHASRMVMLRKDDEREVRQVDTGGLKADPRLAPMLQMLAAVRELAAVESHREQLEQLAAHLERLGRLDATREEFVIGWDEIKRRRLNDMSATQRAAYGAAVDEDEQFAATFVADMVGRFITIGDGQIAIDGDDGAERFVTSGREFAELYGARREVLLAAFSAIGTENTLGDARKNALSSPRDSRSSSGACEPATSTAGPGPTPALIAPSADGAASVTSAAATASIVGTSSGSTAEDDTR